jgi:hypothetical protein
MERDRTLKALRLAESTLTGVLLSHESQTRSRAFFDVVIGGVFFIFAGLEILARSMIWTIIVATVLYGLFWICHLAGQLAAPSWGVLVGGAAIVYFALPSRQSLAGVTVTRVKNLSDGLSSLVTNRSELHRLQAGVELARGNSLERINRTSVVLNLAWGVWFWFFTTHVFAASLSKAQLTVNVNGAVLPLVFFTMTLVMAAAYMAAIRTMHQVLRFALLDVDAQLDVEAPPVVGDS